MGHLIYPTPFRPLPESATKEEIAQHEKQWLQQFKKDNSWGFNSDGTVKSSWQMLKDLFK